MKVKDIKVFNPDHAEVTDKLIFKYWVRNEVHYTEHSG